MFWHFRKHLSCFPLQKRIRNSSFRQSRGITIDLDDHGIASGRTLLGPLWQAGEYVTTVSLTVPFKENVRGSLKLSCRMTIIRQECKKFSRWGGRIPKN